MVSNLEISHRNKKEIQSWMLDTVGCCGGGEELGEYSQIVKSGSGQAGRGKTITSSGFSPSFGNQDPNVP